MGKQSELISIVVPVYNVEKYLSKCIDSIRCQTYSNIQIILVNDGSGDNSGKICDAYALKDFRIKVIHKENGGLVSARQAGLEAAAGEYVGFVDSDDWIEPDMYQTLYDAASDENADIVVEGAIDDFGNECRLSSNRILSGMYDTYEERKMLYGKMLCCEPFFCMGILPYLWNKLFRKELALRHMMNIPQSIRVGEDAAAVYPMFVMADRIVVANTAHYHYCHHETSMMNGSRNETQEYDNVVMLHAFLKKTFWELGIYDLVEKQLLGYMVNNLLTRAYGKVANWNSESVLFPFPNIQERDSVIIYGAGAFGGAVHQYASSCEKISVKAWVDRNAMECQKLGMNVYGPDEVPIENEDKIIVAVFREQSFHEISRQLLKRGAVHEQIIWLDTYKLADFISEIC